MVLPQTIEIEPGDCWARPPSVSSVDATYRYCATCVYGKTIIAWDVCMGKWQDVSAHRPLLVCSLVNNGVTVRQNILPYTRNKNGVCASIKMVSQRNRTHNETLGVLRVLFLCRTPKHSQIFVCFVYPLGYGRTASPASSDWPTAAQLQWGLQFWTLLPPTQRTGREGLWVGFLGGWRKW